MVLLLPSVISAAACGAASWSGDAVPAPGTRPALDASCGITEVNAQTGISVVLWQPYDAGTSVYVHTVRADWYGTDVTVKIDRNVPWMADDGITEVDQALPPSLYGNSPAKGCKILSWR